MPPLDAADASESAIESGVMVDLMNYHGPTKQNKSWVQDCTRGAMDLMYYHGPTQKNKTWVQDCTQGVTVDLMYYHGPT